MIIFFPFKIRQIIFPCSHFIFSKEKKKKGGGRSKKKEEKEGELLNLTTEIRLEPYNQLALSKKIICDTNFQLHRSIMHSGHPDLIWVWENKLDLSVASLSKQGAQQKHWFYKCPSFSSIIFTGCFINQAVLALNSHCSQCKRQFPSQRSAPSVTVHGVWYLSASQK